MMLMKCAVSSSVEAIVYRSVCAHVVRHDVLGKSIIAMLAVSQEYPSVALAKDFDVTGTIDCGARSGHKCDFTDWDTRPVIGMLTEDSSGTRERARIDASWIKDDL